MRQCLRARWTGSSRYFATSWPRPPKHDLRWRPECKWGKARPVGRGPWKVAAEITRPWQEIVRRARLPTSTIPYALRHSSIVRGIRAGLPIRLVASVHDTSTAMIERHYAAFIAGAMDELARRAAMPDMVPAERTGAKVVQLRA